MDFTFDYYKNAEGWKPTHQVTLHHFIQGIRDDSFRPEVQKIRALLAAGNTTEANTHKRLLPAVSLSGTVTGKRGRAPEEGRFTHNGLLQIDLDAKDNIGWTIQEMREELIHTPQIIAVFLSPSGTGVKAIARIPADPATHRAAFHTAEATFAARNLIIDPSCKDPVRLCFVSHDPDAWLRNGPGQEFKAGKGTETGMGSAGAPPASFGAPPNELKTTREQSERNTPTSRSAGVPSSRSVGVPPTSEPTPKTPKGLILRSPHETQLTPATVASMLQCIPPRPPYDQWLKIASAVWDTLGEVAGTHALTTWSPEETPGEYTTKYKHKLQDIHTGTLIQTAQAHGWARPAPTSPHLKNKQQTHETDPPSSLEIPENLFPVPAGDIGHDLAARHIFAHIGPTHRLFLRGTTVHEITTESTGELSLEPVSPARFVSLIENFGPRIMRRETREDGTPRWRSTTFPESSARVALLSDGARQHLPPIRQLLTSPVLVPDGTHAARTLQQGYHHHAGGLFITTSEHVPEIPLQTAIHTLTNLLEDFDFASPGDASRAIASLISPALKIGGWITEDFPLDIAEADQSQSGKTYRQKLICAIYKETPSAITQSTGGVGSLDERVSAALITGRPFISLDNFRGRLDSQIMETAIRGLGKVSARALRKSVDVDCRPFLWQLSTNGAELTRDLANRSIITRIRKRPEDHHFRQYPEGDILAHIKAHQPHHLGSVHAILRHWAAQGRPTTTEKRHDFRGWCRTLDWIVQNIFGFPPLLDGHKEEQMRTANPKLQWLRDILQAILHDGYQGEELTASDLAETAEETDLLPPGRKSGSTEALEVLVGKILSRLFKDAKTDTIIVDGRTFTKHTKTEWDTFAKRNRERKIYLITTPGVQTDPQETEDPFPEELRL